MKNHQVNPTGSNDAPEAHATISRGLKGRKKHQGRGKGTNPQPHA